MSEKLLIQIRILLVEDDKNLGYVIKDSLELSGYSVTLCDNGEKGMNTFYREKFDLCILDIMLPKMDGLTISRNIRKSDAMIPILFLSAKSLKEDKLTGFASGCDDYITKPFSIEELLMRIQVFLKRTGNPAIANTEHYSLGSFSFYYNDLVLKNDSQEIFLTQKEADLLRLFCTRSNQTLKREEILIKIWGDDDYFMGRSLDVFISRLRKYLKSDPSIQIVNHHGIGFKLQYEATL